MIYLGQLAGVGSLVSAELPVQPVAYELDGFRTKQGFVLASGELCATGGTLDDYVGLKDVAVVIEDGRRLGIMIGAEVEAVSGARHVEVLAKGLMPSEWH